MAHDRDFWPAFEPSIAPMLGAEDDPDLWAAVVNAVYRDAVPLCRAMTGSQRAITRLGRCSHWLRPHQTRWTADGGFAWPTGYGGVPWSRSGLPLFDWYHALAWHPEPEGWAAIEPGTRGRFLFRVAVPGRTRRHGQAAVHTTWRYGSPPLPTTALLQFYGFRRRARGWELTAYRAEPDQAAYELAAQIRAEPGPTAPAVSGG